MNSRVGVPTTFKGIKFRSRLEAKWAALFDAMGWPWEYEPFDLRMYIPDFVINFERGPLLVEIKPREEDIEIAKWKIERSGWEHEALIAIDASTPAIGAFLERDENAFLWGDASLFYCISCGLASAHCVSGSWSCRACGAGGDNSHVGEYPTQQAWIEAANRVQWRAT